MTIKKFNHYLALQGVFNKKLQYHTFRQLFFFLNKKFPNFLKIKDETQTRFYDQLFIPPNMKTPGFPGPKPASTLLSYLFLKKKLKKASPNYPIYPRQ